jgi:hypothetical protein
MPQLPLPIGSRRDPNRREQHRRDRAQRLDDDKETDDDDCRHCRRHEMLTDEMNSVAQLLGSIGGVVNIVNGDTTVVSRISARYSTRANVRATFEVTASLTDNRHASYN